MKSKGATRLITAFPTIAKAMVKIVITIVKTIGVTARVATVVTIAIANVTTIATNLTLEFSSCDQLNC